MESSEQQDGVSCPPRRGGEAEAAAVGLPGASEAAECELRREGIDPDRLYIFHLGLPAQLLHYPYPPWVRRMLLGLALWLVLLALPMLGVALPGPLRAALSLFAGLLILQAACSAIITATERLAARLAWDHYVAGTLAEILSTLPELAAIAFIIPVSPQAAFVIALITIYNNALVFSLYSFFLPRDTRGRFLMPAPITEAGTQILIAGAALGLILGLVMLVLSTGPHSKSSFAVHDLVILGLIMLLIFGVYLYKLVHHYAREEAAVREALELGEEGVARRRALVYRNVRRSAPLRIAALFLVGVLGAIAGGERVADFAEAAIGELGLNPVITALILAGAAGMSEYVILWQSHRKREYGIALANAFGGITQVMFLVLPFTLLAIALYQGINPGHSELPIPFTLSNILLLAFLYPTFYVLAGLIEEDHTLGILDATIMSVIFLLLILLLVTYGAERSALHL